MSPFRLLTDAQRGRATSPRRRPARTSQLLGRLRAADAVEGQAPEGLQGGGSNSSSTSPAGSGTRIGRVPRPTADSGQLSGSAICCRAAVAPLPPLACVLAPAARQ